jgi:23S rRNA (cytosine1962-C5)-methyltransferase
MERVAFYAHDIFKSWGKLKRLGPFDLVIVDPPSFQRGSFELSKDYARVVRQLPALLAQEGNVLACLNDPSYGPEYLQNLFLECAPELKFQQRLANPEAFADRDEARALKVLRFQRSEMVLAG